jgi:hypothetical protein
LILSCCQPWHFSFASQDTLYGDAATQDNPFF